MSTSFQVSSVVFCVVETSNLKEPKQMFRTEDSKLSPRNLSKTKHEIVVKEFEDVGQVHRDGAVVAEGWWVTLPEMFTTVTAYYKIH